MKSRIALIATLFAVIVGVGCTTNRKPRFAMETGEPEQFKRYTGRPMVDYIFRWTKPAFSQVNSDVDFVVTSDDQRDVLERHGTPEYIRLDVKAQGNEVFDEWAYWDRNVIVQFVSGDLVYEGPLLDSDRYLVTHGYPSRAYFQEYEIGPAREIWLYEHLFEVGTETLSFSSGQLIFKSRN